MADEAKWKAFDVPLNGRLITKLDPGVLPEGHFQTLQNLCYNDGGIEGVSGMTKINASPFAYTKVKTGFQFRKEIPNTESHVLVQTSSGANSSIVKSDNTTSIPNQDTFSSFITLPTANYVNFSEAPDQSMLACDGYTNYVYSGNEYRVAKFINFNSDGTFSYDYTDIINNNLIDSNNVAVLFSSATTVDSDTSLLLHCDGTNGGTTFTDSSANSHTVTPTGAVTSTVTKKFGTASGYFNGSSYLSSPDSADWNFGTGDFTIDTWVFFTANTGIQGICGQYVDDNNNWYAEMNFTTGNIFFGNRVGSALNASYYISWVPALNTFYHLEFVRHGTSFYIFINGISQVLTVSVPISTNDLSDFAAPLTIGYANKNNSHTDYFKGNIDEFRISKGVARNTVNFTPPTLQYGGAGASVYIGSTRPISGARFYVQTANTSAATVAVSYWDGNGFASATNVVDGTAHVTGKTLSLVTGTSGVISFDSTVALSKVKAINENIAYYYRFDFLGISAGTSLSQVSLVCPVQPLTDIWDGYPRQVYSFLKNLAGVYSDYTLNVYKIDYYAGDTTTYADIGGLVTTDYFYMGFNEKLLGVKFYLAETNVNTNVGIMSIDYWNGAAWVDVGSLDDGTSVSNKTMNRSGVATWNPPSTVSEYITSVGNSANWYYYRVHFNATLSANVFIDNIIGIPAQVSIPPYRFPVLWQNRLWLLNDQSRYKNVAIGSSYGTVCVFNGQDSARLTFGGTQEVMCAAPLFTRYGGSIYENLIVCKRNQTYLVDGTSPSNYIVYKIANSVGCIAPQTMKICDTGYEVAPGLTKHVVIWLSSAGVVMFDANSIINVSADISDRFTSTSPNYINTAIAEQFTAFYDATKTTYHIKIATGTSTTLNEEWCYDLTRRKWYQLVRGAKYLTCGFEVEDDIGNKDCYGGTDDGYLERLEDGNTFDGVSIAYKFRLPDGLLDKSLMYVKEIRRVKLTGRTNTTAFKVTIRHYADGSTTASPPAIATIDQNVSGKTIYQAGRSVNFKGVFHSFEFEISTNDVDCGFNPLYVSGFYRVIREDLEQ